MNPSRTDFQWRRHPEAEAFLDELMAGLITSMPAARRLAKDLMVHTSSRLFDWVDHLILSDGDVTRSQLAALGFEQEQVPAGAAKGSVWYHPGAILPRLMLGQNSGAKPGSVLGLAIQVEEIHSFLMSHQLSVTIEGTPLSPYRRALAWSSDAGQLWVVERRGGAGYLPIEADSGYQERYLAAIESWATRQRRFDDTRAGMESTLRLARSLVSEIGADTAAWIAFAVERAHWQRRNWAGQVQKGRQDRLGLGWANHDHHTFRSSRHVFGLLIKILETFGFRPRERFYAGAEAGWGAQVMEQPVCRFAVFADVDLSPGEAEGDFAHQGLPARDELGTVGLWCALHGESMLTAGLHHVAGRFDFDTVTADLAKHGIDMMHPFSEFSYLQQAFTRGERWQVPDERLQMLAARGQISPGQQERLAQAGAVGSHLENIQRGEGFKGFNQQTVSDIILRTDPRTEHEAT